MYVFMVTIQSFDETCVFFNVTMTTASMTERRRRPIVFKVDFEGKTLVIFALICNGFFPDITSKTLKLRQVPVWTCC
jgi:hypothetical protein